MSQLAGAHSSPPDNGSGQLQPKIKEEHENDCCDPAVDHAGNKAVDKAANGELLEIWKDCQQECMLIGVWKSQPKDHAEDVDDLKQHAGSEHGSKIGKLGHVQSPPSRSPRHSPSVGTPRFERDQFGLGTENVDVAKQVDPHQGAFRPMG